MKYVHYSGDPDLKLEPFTDEQFKRYDEHYGQLLWKPYGFWISTDGPGGWIDWCKSADFGWGQYRYVVQLKPNANILYIKRLTSLIEFDRQYHHKLDECRLVEGINWKQLRGEYQGIIIDPYQYQLRFSLQWYYPWDCASGCIWDIDAIARIQRKELRNATLQR